ncbi:uncharacterized protein LOC126623809 isoform X2 [Malus sylvestris]|uniref:uncharacterized protein LOC126623809 isoform X2 n=1 Tax=Malus sylvestris TaxID=3752 RepID=UPI0021AC1F00|nr:uncharacterized protein LOC126623809 isoform X2 [Malus sylvestris]
MGLQRGHFVKCSQLKQWKNLPKNTRFWYSNYVFSQTSQLLDLGSLQTSQFARKLKLLVCYGCWFIALCIHLAFELLNTSRTIYLYATDER